MHKPKNERSYILDYLQESFEYNPVHIIKEQELFSRIENWLETIKVLYVAPLHEANRYVVLGDALEHTLWSALTIISNHIPDEDSFWEFVDACVISSASYTPQIAVDTYIPLAAQHGKAGNTPLKSAGIILKGLLCLVHASTEAETESFEAADKERELKELQQGLDTLVRMILGGGNRI